MLVGIISRPSSITIQIPHAPLSYGPWIVQNLGLCSLRQRVFILSLSNLVNMLVGIISRLSSITSQIPSGTPRFMALELSKNWISGICSPSQISCSQKCCHYHCIYQKYDRRILCQFGSQVFKFTYNQIV